MEAVLAWEGEVGNARGRQLFGVQTGQTSRLLAEFRALMGDRIFEESRAKVLKALDPRVVGFDISLDEYMHRFRRPVIQRPSSWMAESI